jgi:hypothetical protein
MFWFEEGGRWATNGWAVSDGDERGKEGVVVATGMGWDGAKIQVALARIGLCKTRQGLEVARVASRDRYSTGWRRWFNQSVLTRPLLLTPPERLVSRRVSD